MHFSRYFRAVGSNPVCICEGKCFGYSFIKNASTAITTDFIKQAIPFTTGIASLPKYLYKSNELVFTSRSESTLPFNLNILSFAFVNR